MAGPIPARWTRPLAVVWFLALAAAVTWPTAAGPGEMLLGHPRCSGGCHAWVMWVTAHDLLPNGRLTTDLLFHPAGGDVMRLYGSDLVSPVLAAPWVARELISPWAAYNLWLLLGILLNGLAVYWLARDRRLAPGPAAVAGTLFAVAPFFQHELLNGTSELVFSAALPVFAIGWLRLLDHAAPLTGGPEPAGRWWTAAVLTGLAAGIGGLASAYTPFFLILIAAVALAHRVFRRAEPVFTRRLLVGGALATVLAGVILAPALAMHAAHGAGATHARRVGWDPRELPLPDSSAPLTGFVDPRPVELPHLQLRNDGAVYLYWTLGSVTLGFVGLALAIVGVARRRGAEAALWLGLLITGVVIALGPYLVLVDEVVTLGSVPIPLPSLALKAVLPGFSITALHTYRYTAVIVLALSLLAGLGASTLPARWWTAPLLCALLVLEGLGLSPSGWPLATTDVPTAPFWSELGAEEDSAVLVVPFTGDELDDLSYALLAQTAHGRPWSDGGMHFRADAESLALYEENVVAARLAQGYAASLPGQEESREGLAGLARAGYGVIVLDRARFSRDDLPGELDTELPRGSVWCGDEVESWLRSQLGPPYRDDGRLAAFRIPEVETSE